MKKSLFYLKPTVAGTVCLLLICLLLCNISLKGIQSSDSKLKLEQYLEIELKRIDETYCLLERFAEKIWPGWDNYHEIEFRVRFPNNVHLLVNPRKDVPDGYKQVQGRALRGKSIFINRTEELPLKVEPPLSGGGGGGPVIRIRLRQVKLPLKERRKYLNPSPDEEPAVNSEGQILLYVHEFFHGFQAKLGALEKGSDSLYKFKVNAQYATYANIEGLALLEAYSNMNEKKALEALRDCYIAGEIKQASMPSEAAASEQNTRLLEGTALYSNTKMALLIKNSQYKSKLSRENDPFFFNYRYMDSYFKNNLIWDIRGTMAETLDKVGKCYAFGAGQCYVLDRFVPNWKKGFFQEKKTMDQVIGDFLKLSPQQKKIIAQRLKSKYPFDEIYKRHHQVIKERDEAVELIQSREGRKYIVDFKKIREFPKITPRGKVVRIDVEQIFLHGIEKLQVGDVRLTSIDIPMHRPGLFDFQWIDTHPPKDKKGFEISFQEKTENIYKQLVFKTEGFTLEAPEAQIIEDKEKDEVRIVILSKVPR